MLARLRSDERWRLGAIAFGLAFLVLFPFLGQYGLWDPPTEGGRRAETELHEIAVADDAREIGKHGDYLGVWKREPPLTTWLVAVSTVNFGRNEFAARLPVALLGLVAVMATYALGVRLRRPRAGLYAAIALVGGPLFLFQSRSLTSDIGAVAGAALAMLGFAGLAWPRGARRRRDVVLDGVLLAGGLVLGQLAAGLIVGVLVPLGAAAVAAIPFARADRRRLPFAAAAGAATVLVLLVAGAHIFHLEPAQPGRWQLFGQMLVASRDYLPWIGGEWRAGEAPVTATFNWTIQQVAFGAFPWSAIAPIAVLRLAMTSERDRTSWGGVLVVAWAAVSYLLACAWLRGFGDLHYPGLPALALAIGFFLDDLHAAKLEGDEARLPEARLGLPVAAVFIFIAGVILSLDLRGFPEELAMVHVLGSNVKVPRDVIWLIYAALGAGVAFSAVAAVGVHVPGGPGKLLGVPRARIARQGLSGTLAVGYALALFLSWVFTPKLSQHLSYKNLFEAYFDHRKGDEPLAVMGIQSTGPEYYAQGSFERVDGVARLLDFLRRPERAFAVVPSDRMCHLHQANAQARTRYHVLDTRNSRYYLVSNQLAAGETDVNPLLAAFRSEPPAKFDRDVTANFEDTVELLGVDMPAEVGKREKFEITLWFRVKKRFPDSKQIFLHFDHTSGVRFLGDHWPTPCHTTFWQPGDIVAETHTLTAAPALTNPGGTYHVHMGFFTGGSGSYKNMAVLTSNKDAHNRVNLGTLRVR